MRWQTTSSAKNSKEKKTNPNMPATEKSSSKHLPMAINNKPESAVRWVIGTET